MDMDMDLFDYMREMDKEQESPLASRMRPVTLEDVALICTNTALVVLAITLASVVLPVPGGP